MKDQAYYNLVAGALALGIVALMVAWTAMSVGAGVGAASDAAGSPAGPAHMYLTVQINPNNGAPQYSPANFTVPEGEVLFTIVDYDVAAPWPGCTCNVTGTVGNVETVNGTTLSEVPYEGMGHTFTIPALGLNVLSPGNSTVTFAVDLTQPGSYLWVCMDPCGSDGFTGAPMGEAGYMSGTMTVV